MAHIALLQDACRPQQRLNPDEAVFQRLDVLAITVIELVMIDEHEIGNGNGHRYRCTFGNHPAFHAGPERYNAYYGACIVYILN